MIRSCKGTSYDPRGKLAQVPSSEFQVINYFVPIRMTVSEEYLGADFVEHAIVHPAFDYSLAIEELRVSELGIPHIPFDLSMLSLPTANRKTFDYFVIQQ